jgi:Cd2+/Zn2+-exporting ATPase
MEAADVVIMNDDLRRIPETIRLSRRTIRIHAVLWQNIALALGARHFDHVDGGIRRHFRR